MIGDQTWHSCNRCGRYHVPDHRTWLHLRPFVAVAMFALAAPPAIWAYGFWLRWWFGR